MTRKRITYDVATEDEMKKLEQSVNSVKQNGGSETVFMNDPDGLIRVRVDFIGSQKIEDLLSGAEKP